MIRRLHIIILFYSVSVWAYAQLNTDRVMAIARNALYFEDYILSIQYFNQVISAKPYLYEPYFFRGLAKANLEDFQGAERDCSLAIERNPFAVGCYQVRGYARIQQKNYAGAIADYEKALEYDPENSILWNNIAFCKLQQKDYDGAEKDIDQVIKFAPRESNGYLMRADIAMKQQDTLKAEQNIEQAIQVDAYSSNVWSARAILRIQQKRYSEAEEDLDQAIYLVARNADNYINRALTRYYQSNLRGAMEDYDIALRIDPQNFIGHYNRGLLRAYVGDDNRAIEDFDFVIMQEPDNMMAIFNRALLLDKIGELRRAIQDYSTVLTEYPNFMVGYQYRAQARRKAGDLRGAEEDELVLLQDQIDRQSGKKKEVASNDSTRKKSDKNMNNYRKIVVADESDDMPRYTSAYRGRVQDKNIRIEPQPMYVLTFYEKENEIGRTIHYYKSIDDLNHDSLFAQKRLLLTNHEVALSEAQVEEHFSAIDEHTLNITQNEKDARLRFLRGLDFYLVQDFDNAIDDYTEAILLDETFFPAYFNRAITLYKKLEYQKAESGINKDVVGVGNNSVTTSLVVKSTDYELVKKDLDQVINLDPEFMYAYYNRGNLYWILGDYRAAIADYTKTIELDEHFAEAYYNRGLTYIYLGNNKQGIADLSKAGELGLFEAYNVIKRFTDLGE